MSIQSTKSKLFANELLLTIISRVDKVLRLLVASSHGYLYVYNLDMEEGGECSLWRTHRFVIQFVCTFCMLFLKIIQHFLIPIQFFRLDGIVDVVDSPKQPIISKEINSTKLDKNTKTESPINSNQGK